MRSEKSILPGHARVGVLGIVIIVMAVELLAISLLYQHGFDFTCRDMAPVWFCAFAGRIVPRALGVLAALVLFAIARSEAVRGVLDHAGAPGPGLSLNAAGFLLVLLPWFGLSDASGATAVTVALVAWATGGILMAAGLGLSLANWAFWQWLMSRHGPTLAVLVAVGLLLPELADLLQPLWGVEAVTTITFSAVILTLLWIGYDPVSMPADKVIGQDDFFVAVGPQCSGVEGFLLITVFLTLYISLFRRELRFPNILLLYPVGLALSWVFNVLRISILLVIGIEGQPELAVGAFHSHAGWLAFTTLSILLILVSRAVPWFMRNDESTALVTLAPFFRDPAVARILPFIVFMGAALLVSTLSTSPSLHYPWLATAMGSVLVVFWPFLRDLPWRIDPVALGGGVAIATLWIATAPSNGDVPYGDLAGVALTIWLGARLVGTTVFVPVIEELFFRGYLLERFSPSGRGWSMILAIVVSTAFFAVLHDRWIVAAIAGLVFAGLVWRSRNVTDAIVAHAVANGVIALWALTTDAWHIL